MRRILLMAAQTLASVTLELEQAQERIAALELENKILHQKVDALSRRLFGKSSEKLSQEQLQLIFEALLEAPSLSPTECLPPQQGQAALPLAQSPGKARPKRKLEDIIAGLPVTEVIVDPEEVKAEPDAWECIGEEQTQLIDYIPGKFSCQRIRRRKYVRKAQRNLPPVTAPLSTLPERCIAAPSLLAHTMSLRFEFHLPFYRIEQMYGRMGVPISRQTMSNWAGMSSQNVKLVIDAIEQEVFADGYCQADETPVKYQDRTRDGVCGTGWLWTFHNPVRQATLFRWKTGRGARDLEGLVPSSFTGKLQCDGHGAYTSFAESPKRSGQIELAGCMAHARRKFFEANSCPDAQWVLGQIGQLYRIEEQLDQARAGPDEVLQIRQQQSTACPSYHQDCPSTYAGCLRQKTRYGKRRTGGALIGAAPVTRHQLHVKRIAYGLELTDTDPTGCLGLY